MDYFFLFEKISAFTSSLFPSANRMRELKKRKKKDWERIRNNIDNVEEKMSVLLVGLFGKFTAGL